MWTELVSKRTHARTRDVLHVVELTERVTATASSAVFLAPLCESKHGHVMRAGEGVAAVQWSIVQSHLVWSERASIGSFADRLVRITGLSYNDGAPMVAG